MIATYTEHIAHFTGRDGAKYRIRPADTDVPIEQGYIVELKGTFHSYCGNVVPWLPFGQKETFDEAVGILIRMDEANEFLERT